jgi:transcription termination factor Rho
MNHSAVRRILQEMVSSLPNVCMRRKTLSMALDITTNGIVFRHDGGGVTIHRPGKNGGMGVVIEVPEELANRYRLATGDVIVGSMEPIREERAATAASDECMEDAYADDERDEPLDIHGAGIPLWLTSRLLPNERLAAITQINGLPLEQAEERPTPRRKRSQSERGVPDRQIPLATGPHDETGRVLDFAAPLGFGYAGIIYGPHGSGLTRTLRSVVSGVIAHAPDCLVIVLLLRARGEELTDWRRRFPQAEVVICPTQQDGATPDQILQMADLALAAARRQTELGRDALVAVDSLTGLWGSMLEAEAADAQADADQARARQRIREWIQHAGNFSGAGPLGATLGGSLTIVGTMWQQTIDADAEEDRELHPHLRLLEHILHETSWRAPLSPELAAARLYPAIDVTRCLSRDEQHLLPPELHEQILQARGALARLPLRERYFKLLDAIDATPDNAALARKLAVKTEAPAKKTLHPFFTALPIPEDDPDSTEPQEQEVNKGEDHDV